MSWIAVAIVGGNLVSGLIGGSAAESAASTQAGAANNATAAELAMYNTTAANVAPWLTAGQGSLQQLVAGTQPGGALMPSSYTPYGMTQFQASPEYQTMQMQDTAAINASQNASSISGGGNSNNLKGLLNWTQGNATSQYTTALNNYMNQFLQGNQAKANQFSTLNTLSQTGLGAGLQQGQIGATVAGQVGSNTIGAGNATAAGTVGAANAITGAGSSAYNQYLQQQYLTALTGQSSGLGYDPNAYMAQLNAQAAAGG